MSWVPLSSLCSLQHTRASGGHKLLSLEEIRKLIKEEEALQQEGEGKRKDGEENHPYTLYLALYSSHSKDLLKEGN